MSFPKKIFPLQNTFWYYYKPFVKIIIISRVMGKEVSFTVYEIFHVNRGRANEAARQDCVA